MDYYRSLDAATLDPDVPTVFELLAARQLTDLLSPYVRFVLVYYAQRNPAYLLRFVKWYDEIYLALYGSIEYAHLSSWNASFVEKFYGLKRTNRLPVLASRTHRATPGKVDPLRRLSRAQVWGSVAALAIVPYLREKASVRYERLQGRYAFRQIEEDQPPQDAPLLEHWKHQGNIALLKWYPRYVLAERTLGILFIANYLFRGTGPSSFTDLVLNTRYSRLSSWDYTHNAKASGSRLRTLARKSTNMLGYALPATLFVLKFLEWWNSSELTSKLANSGPDLPPPQTGVETTWKACPICGRAEPENPTVLETGVVYCYKCIWDYLENQDSKATPRCPATNIELLLTSWNLDSKRWDIGGLRRIIV